MYPETPIQILLLFHHWALSVGHGPSGAVDRYGANLFRAGGAVPRLDSIAGEGGPGEEFD